MKRYVVTINYYEWASNDKEAQIKAQEECNKMIKEKDNYASIVSIHQNNFGQIGSRQLNLEVLNGNH